MYWRDPDAALPLGLSKFMRLFVGANMNSWLIACADRVIREAGLFIMVNLVALVLPFDLSHVGRVFGEDGWCHVTWCRDDCFQEE